MRRTLPVERTLLAWRRTCLSLGAGFALAIRLLAAPLGGVAVTVGVVGLVGVVAAWPLPHRRLRRRQDSADAEFVLGATCLAALTALTILVGGLALAAALVL